MAETSRHDAWQAGDSYDSYMGRWSRQIAPRFLDWLEVGCEPVRCPPLSFRAATRRA